jgi:hypothetical protein
MGFVVASCVPMVTGNALLLYVFRRMFPAIRLWPKVRAAIAGGAVVGLVGKFALSDWAYGAFRFSVSVLALAVLFCLVVAALDPPLLKEVLEILNKRRGVAESVSQ